MRSGIAGLICLASINVYFESTAQAAERGAKNKPLKVAKATETTSNEPPAPSTPRAASASLMTTSTSVASGMMMAAKYMPITDRAVEKAHPITSLRQNKSNAQFDLGMGNWIVTSKNGDYEDAEANISIMHVGLGTTIVSSQGIRFGAHLEIMDDPVKTKYKKPYSRSEKKKSSAQDISFFAAAGVTPNFGMSLMMIMTDRKFDDKKESATLVSPAVMGMFNQTEVIFDMIQSNEDVNIKGHWRLSGVHKLENSMFLTGHLMRVQPSSGDDYWNIALGGRNKTSTVGSLGAELLYVQQYDDDDGKCVFPSHFGFRADVDHELATGQVVSVGGQYTTGNCSRDDAKITFNGMEFKGAFTMLF